MHFKNQYLLNKHKTTITTIFITDNLYCLLKKLFNMFKQIESIYVSSKTKNNIKNDLKLSYFSINNNYNIRSPKMGFHNYQ